MSKMISWDDQRFFLAVLEEGSLSGAARRLGVSQPTVRSRIEALEQTTGVTLFTRSLNGLTPTDHARHLRTSARAMALASEAFLRQASAPPGEIAGTVRLSVPEVMGTEIIPEMLAPLRKAYPLIQIELELSNDAADVLHQEVDLAVRTFAPSQNALVARKVASIPLGFFAREDYLQEHGEPRTLADLKDHATIGPDRNKSDLQLVRSLGLETWALPKIRTDSHPAQLAAALAGLGIAYLQVPIGRRHPSLRQVLLDIPPYALDTWIVTHEDLRHEPRIRAAFDCLVEGFSSYVRKSPIAKRP
nr:LysR family transcriptional regulator [uncultured Cohaesibacter sp.]